MSQHLFVIAAPSGTGKTSLVEEILRRDDKLAVSVSHTTRPKRPQETNGVHYHFVSRDKFAEMQSMGMFLESATVFQHHYATSRAGVEQQFGAGKDVILEIDWQGARQVRETEFTCKSIYILPPSLEELEMRLRSRGQDDERTVTLRMREALSELEHYTEFDFVVLNQSFGSTADMLLRIVQQVRDNRLVELPDFTDLANRLLAGEP